MLEGLDGSALQLCFWNTLVSLRVVLGPKCSSPRQISHDSGTCNILGSLMYSWLHFHIFMQWPPWDSTQGPPAISQTLTALLNPWRKKILPILFPCMLWGSRKYLRPFIFTSWKCSWTGLALRAPRPWFHFASDFLKLLISVSTSLVSRIKVPGATFLLKPYILDFSLHPVHCFHCRAA